MNPLIKVSCDIKTVALSQKKFYLLSEAALENEESKAEHCEANNLVSLIYMYSFSSRWNKAKILLL